MKIKEIKKDKLMQLKRKAMMLKDIRQKGKKEFSF